MLLGSLLTEPGRPTANRLTHRLRPCASQAESETALSTASSTSTSTSTIFETAASTTAAQPQPEREWVLVIDDGGKLGVTIPSDWSFVVEEDAIWASPAIDEWVAATTGNGPASHEGYYVRRIRQPDTGALQDIANEHLREMLAPTQCAMALSTVDRIEAAAFVYRIYDCAPGGSYVNEVEVGINPPWVTLESSRYLDEDQRERVHAVIWQSLRTY